MSQTWFNIFGICVYRLLYNGGFQPAGRDPLMARLFFLLEFAKSNSKKQKRFMQRNSSNYGLSSCLPRH